MNLEKPGTSRHLVLPSQVDRSFFEKRSNPNPEKDPNWKLRVELPGGIQEYIGVNWEVVSRFGRVSSVVVVDDAGNPQFDRPRYEEAPNVNVIAWGTDETGAIKIGFISQPRPHADNRLDPKDTEDVVFQSAPVGFIDKIIGKDQMEAFEHPGAAAAREVAEETGATVVKSIAYPQIPFHYPNPTFVGTTSDIVFVEVDLKKIEELKKDHTEPIFTAEYRPIQQVLQDLQNGQSELGLMRMATTNSALLIFLSTIPEFANATTNQSMLNKQVNANKTMKANDPEAYKILKLQEFALQDPEGYNEYQRRNMRKKYLIQTDPLSITPIK